MKKKNIAFSGFMAAILLGANANAATQIASRQYVDNKESSILTSVSENYATQETVNSVTENVTNITQQVTNLNETVNNAETGLKTVVDQAAKDAAAAKTTAEEAKTTAGSAQTDVDALEKVVGNAEAGLVKDVADAKTAASAAGSKADAAGVAAGAAQDAVDALETTVEGHTASITQIESDLDKKEDVANKAKTISAQNQSSETAYPTVGAIVQWTNSEIQKLSDTGLPVNPDNIGDNSISGDKLQNGAVTTEKIADGAVTEDKIGEDLAAKIAGKADKATTLQGYGITDAYTKTETEGKIKELAIPQPDAKCTAASGTCVLSVSTSGTLEWVDVTEPAE